MIECTDEYLLKRKKKIKRRKKSLKKIFIFIIVFALFFSYQKFIVSESIYKTCYDYLVSSSIENINNAVLISTQEKFGYDNLINVEKNNEGDIVLISANNQKINSLSRKITEFTKIEVTKTLEKGVPIPWVAFLGIGYLSGLGKKVYVKTVNVASVNCDFISNFESKGINHTLHSIYADISCEINLEIPFNNKTISSSSKVLVCESVLLGKVPDFYFGKNML